MMVEVFFRVEFRCNDAFAIPRAAITVRKIVVFALSSGEHFNSAPFAMYLTMCFQKLKPSLLEATNFENERSKYYVYYAAL